MGSYLEERLDNAEWLLIDFSSPLSAVTFCHEFAAF